MLSLKLLVVLFFGSAVLSDDFQSPCPGIFRYEPPKDQNKWYGVATLISDIELSGVWLKVILDRPAEQFGVRELIEQSLCLI